MKLGTHQIDSLHLGMDSIQQLLRDHHSSGASQHFRTLSVGNQVFEFNIGAVRSVCIDDATRRGSGRQGATACPLRTVVPVIFNCRNADTLADLGYNGVAAIDLSMVFETPIHRGGVPVHLNDHIRIDCTATSSEDIRLFGLREGERSKEVAAILVELVHRYLGGTIPLPSPWGPLTASKEPIEVVTSATLPQQVIISRALLQRRGLPQTPRLETPFASFNNSAWAAFISVQSLAPLLDQLACDVRGFLETSAGAPQQEVRVTLEDGFLGVTRTSPSSNEEQRRDAPSMHLRVGVGVVALTGAPVAHVHGNPGAFAEPTTERRVAGLACELVARFINTESSVVHSERPADLGVAALVTTRQSDGIQSERQIARLSYPEFRRSGLFLHGVIDQLEGQPPPVAEFRYLRTTSSRLQFTFNAMPSWSPGHEITCVYWDFGDGASLSSSGPDISLVTSHTFEQAGEFDVALKVEDSIGRTASKTSRIRIGLVELGIGTPLSIGPERCVTVMTIKSGNTPLPGVSVQLRLLKEHRMLTADVGGRVFVDDSFALLDQANLQQSGRDLAEKATVVIETAAGPVEWPVRIIDSQSYSRMITMSLKCDQILCRAVPDSPPSAPIVAMRSLVAEMQKGLRNGTALGAAALMDLYAPTTGKKEPSADMPSSHLDAISGLIERLLERARKPADFVHPEQPHPEE